MPVCLCVYLSVSMYVCMLKYYIVITNFITIFNPDHIFKTENQNLILEHKGYKSLPTCVLVM